MMAAILPLRPLCRVNVDAFSRTGLRDASASAIDALAGDVAEWLKATVC